MSKNSEKLTESNTEFRHHVILQEEVEELQKRLDDAEAAIKERDLKITMLEKQKKEMASALKKLLEELS